MEFYYILIKYKFYRKFIFYFYYSKLHESLANKEIAINDLKLIVELVKDEIKIMEKANKQLLNEKETFILNSNRKNNALRNSSIDKAHKHQNSMDNNHDFPSVKEADIANKFKEKEIKIREDFNRQLKDLNKRLQEKTLQNEKLIFEAEILKSNNQNKDIDDKEKYVEFRSRIKNLETDNEKLILTNKMNAEIISQLENKKNLNLEKSEKLHSEDFLNEPSGKQFYLNSTNTSNFSRQNKFYKNEILIIDLKSQISKLENSLEAKEKLIENLKDKVKNYTNDNLRKDFELKNNLFDMKNKELNQFYSKIQTIENEKNALIEENEELKSSLEKSLNKIRELENLINNKYLYIESSHEREKADKEILENKLREMSKIYKENHENLIQDANYLRGILAQKDEEIEKIKARYENRIQQVIFK